MGETEITETDGRADGQIVSWMVGQSGGWVVGRLGGQGSWGSELSAGQLGGRTVGRKGTLEQDPSDNRTVGRLERR